MNNSIPKGTLALEFLKVSATRLHNRCENCGRRLKLKPGSFIIGTMIRFRTCRSCGHENPTLSEAVFTRLAEAGYDAVGSGSTFSDLPECMTCGVGLLVSRDFTKVFCSTCGREWGRAELESDLGSIDPRLAGELPFPPDQSALALQLEELLEQKKIDSGTIYFTTELRADAGIDSKGLVSVIRESFLEGWRQNRGTQPAKQNSTPKTPTMRKILAVHEECIAIYTVCGDDVQVSEHKFDEELRVVLSTKSELQKYRQVVNSLAVIESANRQPHQSASQFSKNTEASSNLSIGSLAGEIERLLRLKETGVLTEEEFQIAKSKLLKN
jgi:hypothetical protein